MLSLLQTMLTAGSVHGLVLAILLFTRKHNRFANKILGLLMIIVCVHLYLAANDNRSFFMQFPHLSHITWWIPTLYGPLIFMFVRAITISSSRFKKRDLVLFVPFVLYFFYLLPYYLKSAAYKRAYLSNFELSVKDDFGWLNQTTNFLHIGFSIAAIFAFHYYEKRIRNFYSDLSKVRLLWLKQFVYAIFGIMVFSVAVFYARKFQLPVLTSVYPFHFLAIVALLYWIGYKMLSQPQIFTLTDENVEAEKTFLPIQHAVKDFKMQAERAVEEVNVQQVAIDIGNEENFPKYRNSGLDEAQLEELYSQLLQYMNNEKPYLQAELTIQELADGMQMSKHQLSQIINVRAGKNYYDFINDYRIGAFKTAVSDPANANLTLLAIAMDCGFNSKATFNAVFKKKTGLTPSQFQQQSRLETALA